MSRSFGSLWCARCARAAIVSIFLPRILIGFAWRRYTWIAHSPKG